jgi:hypothetical protein
MFYHKDKMDNDLLVSGDVDDFTNVFEGLVGLDVCTLFGHSNLPERVAILYIKLKCLFDIARDHDAKVVDWGRGGNICSNCHLVESVLISFKAQNSYKEFLTK